eukprot:COSAG02_NODE_916_length_15971_cov_12.781061_13_plen_82_part_00
MLGASEHRAVVGLGSAATIQRTPEPTLRTRVTESGSEGRENRTSSGGAARGFVALISVNRNAFCSILYSLYRTCVFCIVVI